MSAAFSSGIISKLEARGIIAVLVIDRAEDGISLAQALVTAGMGAFELTLRTPGALSVLSGIKGAFPDVLVGAGTVIAPEQIAAVMDSGADFAVAPGCNPRVLAAASAVNFPFGPGVATPSDIEAALEYGCNVLKFFPAEPAGGLAYLKTMTAPYAHLGLRYIPLGGVSEQTAPVYLEEPSVVALGGSWIAPRELIQARDWDAISRHASRAMAIVENLRTKK